MTKLNIPDFTDDGKRKVRRSAYNHWKRGVLTQKDPKTKIVMENIIAHWESVGIIGNADYDWLYENVFVYSNDGNGTWYNAPGSEGAVRPKGLQSWKPKMPTGWVWNSKPCKSIKQPFRVV
ncbi:MAG: hypothetical protein ACRYGG_18245 [Janthinobacterium lividum]